MILFVNFLNENYTDKLNIENILGVHWFGAVIFGNYQPYWKSISVQLF